jgi:hypothetical protein
VPPVTEPTEMYPEAEVVDAAGDIVAKARVTWKVQPSASSRPAATSMAGSLDR